MQIFLILLFYTEVNSSGIFSLCFVLPDISAICTCTILEMKKKKRRSKRYRGASVPQGENAQIFLPRRKQIHRRSRSRSQVHCESTASRVWASTGSSGLQTRAPRLGGCFKTEWLILKLIVFILRNLETNGGNQQILCINVGRIKNFSE